MKYRFKLLTAAVIAVLAFACGSKQNSSTANTQAITNPIIDGYYADPTIVKHNGTYYIYATIDPWGANELAVLTTKDFVSFQKEHINWPTKEQCTTPTSSDAMVWAPAVVKGTNGKFYMYVSVGSEVWGGVADSPLGPWKNMKADNTPLVAKNDFPKVHNIDSDCFIDTDGQAYLYWGSGYNWVNGKCMVVKLKKDMHTFDGIPQDVTPPGYFEGPHMIKRNNKYYLMFSEGKAINATYKVGYATGNSPLGPFTKGVNSPILQTSKDSVTYGPGHHTVFTEKGQDYILYHRIKPQKQDYVLRQLCLDSLKFDKAGNILPVVPGGIRKIQN